MVTKEVLVISDLHLGGRKAVGSMCTRTGAHGGVECDEPHRDRVFRINTHVLALAAFIAHLTKKAVEAPRVELVINGDFCDFLAEGAADGSARPFISDSEEALAVFERILERDAEVFDALRAFVTKGHQLTVILGNHDVELSLPVVRARLRDYLGIRPDSRFTFVYDNEAYVVGDVLIEHGNRCDGWNAIAHDQLRQLRSWQSRRLAPLERLEVPAPAGSELVARVMNEVKESYAFVDLLKPEDAASLPILLALDPSLRKRIPSVALFAGRAAAHAPVRPAEPRFASDIAGSSATAPDFGMDIGALTDHTSDEDVNALRLAVDEALGSNAAAFLEEIDEVLGANDDGGFSREVSALDTAKKIWGWAGLAVWPAETRDKRMSSLLTAIRCLQHDDTFDLNGPEKKPYLDAAKRLVEEGGFRVVVFGHTHLAREIEVETGAERVNGQYLNTGTWADVMEFPKEVVSGARDEALVKLIAFADELAENRIGERIAFRPTYAHIRFDESGKSVAAKIMTWEG